MLTIHAFGLDYLPVKVVSLGEAFIDPFLIHVLTVREFV